MEYKMEQSILCSSEVICDSNQERSVDVSVNLPDYCPDVHKILKCQLYPSILNKGITGNRLDIDGSYTIRIFYLDRDGKSIHCCEHAENFSTSVSLKKEADLNCMWVYCQVEYINCRAANSRKIDVHGAFSIHSKVICQNPYEVTGNILEEDAQQLLSPVDFTKLAAFETRPFTIEEILELSESKPEPDSVLYAKAFIRSTEYKIIPGKVMLKGDMTIKILYTPGPEEDIPECMEYDIPFTQVLDCPGITEDCQCDLRLQSSSCDVQIRNEYTDDKIYFQVQIRFNASVVVYLPEHVEIVSDAYSRKYAEAVEKVQVETEQLENILQETLLEKVNFPLAANVSKIIDVWNEMCGVETEINGKNIRFIGKYNVCVLMLTEDGEINYMERVADFLYESSVETDSPIRLDPECCISDMSYRLSSGEIEIKTEIQLTSSVFICNSVCAVKKMTADENDLLPEDPAAICIYYAQKGETLWEIAKQYRSSLREICQENNLSETSLEEPGMILIPVHAE